MSLLDHPLSPMMTVSRNQDVRRLHPHRNQDQRRAHRHGPRRQGAAASAHARQSVQPSVVAQIRAAAGGRIHRGRHRSARLRRFRKAARRRQSCQLFVPRHGAGPDRGDGGARPQPLLCRRPRSRRARAAPHVPRSSASGRARGHPRHRPAASSVQQRQQGLGDVLVALVLHDPALRFPRAPDERRSRFFHREEARQDQARLELLRSAGARRIQALYAQSGDRPRHVRGLSRLRRHRLRHGHQGFRRRAKDRLPGAAAVGRDRRRRPQSPAARNLAALRRRHPRRQGAAVRPLSVRGSAGGDL